jgi:ribose transport system substrate-binding protein
MKHARCTIAALGVVAVLAAAGCSSSGSGSSSSGAATSGGAASSASASGAGSNKAYTFAYANISDSSPLFKLVGDTMVSNGKKVNVTMTRFDNNLDPSKALSNAQLMVQEKPDVAIDWTGTESIGESIGAVFQRAGVKCIAVNQQITGCPFFNLVNADLGSGSADIVAPIMKQKGWGAADTTLVLLFNPGAGAEVNSNVRYFYSDVAKQFPGMPQMSPTQITDKTTTIGSLPSGVQLNGQDALEPSYTAMKNELQLLPSNRHIVIFTQNDDSAMGAWRAITQAGRQNNTLIIGQGADADALKQLRTNPQWVAEGSVFFELWSEYLLAMGVAIMDGQTPPALTLPPQTVLSKQTVSKYYGANGTTATVAPPLDPRDDYLLKTGILQQFGNIEGVK